MTISENLPAVRNKIAQACQDAGRRKDACELIAVSKTVEADHLRPALDAGQRVFGENRIQESIKKWPQLKADYDNVELHLIGPLQSNKTREAVEHFDVVQTVDREKIATMLAKETERQGRSVSFFVQVNIGEEEQKAGINPAQAVDFTLFCQNELELSVRGLMCIPPVGENPAPYFALLRKLADQAQLSELSMGMSGDFEEAAAFGATYVRVGSAVFGARN